MNLWQSLSDISHYYCLSLLNLNDIKYDDFQLLNILNNEAVIIKNENEDKEESVKDMKKNENVQISLKFKKLNVSEDDFNINLKISLSLISIV